MEIKRPKMQEALEEKLVVTDGKIGDEIVQTTEFGEGEVLKSIEKNNEKLEETEQELDKMAKPVVDATAAEHKDEVFGKLQESIDVTDRSELSKYITECKEKNLKYFIKRSLKEGFRYELIREKEQLDESFRGDMIDKLVTEGTCEDVADAEAYLDQKEDATDKVDEPADAPVEESLGEQFAKFYSEHEDADTSLFEDLFLKYNPEADRDIDEVINEMNEADKDLIRSTYLTEAAQPLNEANNYEKLMSFLNNLTDEEPKEESLDEAKGNNFDRLNAHLSGKDPKDIEKEFGPIEPSEPEDFDREKAAKDYAKINKLLNDLGEDLDDDEAPAEPEEEVADDSETDLVDDEPEEIITTVEEVKDVALEASKAALAQEEGKEEILPEEEVKEITDAVVEDHFEEPEEETPADEEEAPAEEEIVDVDDEEPVEENLEEAKEGTDEWKALSTKQKGDLARVKKDPDWKATDKYIVYGTDVNGKVFDKKEVTGKPADAKRAREELLRANEDITDVYVAQYWKNEKSGEELEVPLDSYMKSRKGHEYKTEALDVDDEIGFFEPLDADIDIEDPEDDFKFEDDLEPTAGDFDYEDIIDSISFITDAEDNPVEEETKTFNFDIYKTDDDQYVAYGIETPFGPADDPEELKDQIRDFMGKSDFNAVEEEQTFEDMKEEEVFEDDDESDLDL